MEKIFEGTVQPVLEELVECGKIQHKHSHGGSYFSFYALGGIMLAAVAAEVILSGLINWFFVAGVGLAGIFLLFQPIWFIPRLIKKEVENGAFDQNKKSHIILTDVNLIKTPIPGSAPSYTEVNIPYSRLTGVIESADLFIFFIDNIRKVVLPKRYLTSDEITRISLVSGAKRM